eukprot:c24433_g1_i1 orf=151-1704(+)
MSKPSTMRAMCAPGGLSSEMLALEPVKMVNMKEVGCEDDQKLQLGGIPDLQILELSNVDHLYDYYNSVCLFYDVQSNELAGDDGGGGKDGNGNGNGCDGPVVKRLQAALEELLVHYPAAAGQLCHSEPEGRLEIHYNSAPSTCHTSCGNGVQFVVAHANIALYELGDVSDPHPSLDLLYPSLLKQSQDSSGKHLPRPVMAIQVTTFTCGGFTLAHVCSHAFVDGNGGATFLQNLCSIARRRGLALPPDTLSSRREVMKPRMPPSPTMPHISVQAGRPGEAPGKELLPYRDATRFAFSTAALEALRLRASNFDASQAANLCSRYLALVALLWTARAKSLVASSTTLRRLPGGGGQELPLRFPMNLRERGVPRLTRGYIGNAILPCTMRATLQELCENPLPYVVGKIKSALVGLDMLECVQSQTDYIELQLRAGHVPCIDEYILAMPSLVSLPFYDTDCGWGRPIYCGRPSRQLSGRFIILDHPAAGAWNVLAVFNSQEEHAFFQEEIAEYISSSSTSS